MISIIIPTLNEEKYLPLLLDSVKQQDFRDYEVIVADAGSKDKTREIAHHYGCKLVEGGVPAVGRNRGAVAALGDILLFVDADVTLPGNFLKKSIAQFQKNNLGIAGFPNNVDSKNLLDRFVSRFFSFFARATQKVVPHACMVIMARKSVHNAIGGFDETVLIHEDLCYARAMARISRYQFINNIFFVSDRRYRQDGPLTYVKYALAELYTIFIGPVRTDIFKYKFNHYKKEK